MEPGGNEHMTASSLKLALTFEAAGLQSDLRRILAAEFIPHFNTGYYQGDWTVVPLRSIGGRADQIYSAPPATRKDADTPLLDRCPHVRAAIGAFSCEFQAVRFLRLKAASVVKEHTDYNLG